MKHWQTFVLILVFAVTARARVYYLQNLDGNRYGDAAYPFPEEQSSRDLDLSFSAGDASESETTVRPVKKVYTLVAPEKQYVEVNKETDWPVTYYKLAEAPVKRSGQDDIIVVPEKNRKLVKINGNNKGEVILELRVIANHDSA